MSDDSVQHMRGANTLFTECFTHYLGSIGSMWRGYY